MFPVLIQLDFLFQPENRPIDANAQKTFPAGFVEDITVFTLFPSCKGSQYLDSFPFIIPKNEIEYFVQRVTVDELTADRAMGNTHAAEKETKVIVNLGDCSYS